MRDESELHESLSKLAESVKEQPEGSIATHVHEFLLSLGLPEANSTRLYSERVTPSDHRLSRIRIRRRRFTDPEGRIDCELRDTRLFADWNPHVRIGHRCGALMFDETQAFAALVEPGERLEITIGRDGRLVLR